MMLEELFEKFIDSDYFLIKNDKECGGVSIWSKGNPYQSWNQPHRCIFIIGNKVYMNMTANYSGWIIDRENENLMYQYIKDNGYKLYSYMENWYYPFSKQIEESCEKDIDFLIKQNTK